MKKIQQLFVNQKAIHWLRAKQIFGVVAACAALATAASEASAQTTILSDGFTNQTNQFNNALIGTSPDGANLGGGVWGYTGANDYDNRLRSTSAYPVPVTGSAYFSSPTYADFASSRNGTGAAISVSSNGYMYIAPLTMTISAYVNPVGPLNQGSNNANNLPATAYLGFYSQTQSAHYTAGPDTHLAGLSLSSTGALNFDVNGTTYDSGISPVTFDADGFVNLAFTESYDPINKLVTIDNIFVDGTSLSGYYLTTGDAVNPLAYAGFGGNSDGFAYGAAFTDLTVTGDATSVPEPSTYGMLAAGALVLGAYQYRRRTSASL